jgi:hypothetical protein
VSGVPQIADVNYEALNGRGRSYEVIGRRTDAIAEGCKSGPLGELWVLSPGPISLIKTGRISCIASVPLTGAVRQK